MNIKEIAEKLNELSHKYQMNNFQQIRKQIHKFSRITYPKIFSSKTISEGQKSIYAFHYGGRSEIQYNIGYEKEKRIFRYGLAFSLESSISLKEPISVLASKIERFNEYIKLNPGKYSDMYMWDYQDSKRSKNRRITTISKSLIKNNNFIFIGKYFDKQVEDITREDLEEVLKTFDRLLELYKYVEESNIIEDKIARICWNDYGWQRPSGHSGKSKDKDSYEFQTGYGHEEWLFDTGKIINGYHYGYLQQVKDKYRGKTLNVSFYTINSKTREKLWVGTIKNVEIISKEESEEVYLEYKKEGWISEMINQLKNVGADFNAFNKVDPESFFNIKYKIENLELLDSPLRISGDDKSMKSFYYSSFLDKEIEPELETPVNKEFKFNPQHKTKRETAKASYGKRESEVDLFHNRMTDNSYKQLTKLYGKENVGMDQDTGLGSQIDLVVRDKDSYIFYEFKTSNSIRSCIREALSQLLEYSYYPNEKRAKKLIIVSHNKINKEAKEYLKLLRENFKIPIYYRYYNPRNDILEETEY